MKSIRYDHPHARALLPLLEAIAREIDERNELLESLEERMDTLVREGSETSDTFIELVADAACQRRELRHALEELHGLGCSVVGTTPLTIRIPGERGPGRRSFVWQTGATVLQ